MTCTAGDDADVSSVGALSAQKDNGEESHEEGRDRSGVKASSEDCDNEDSEDKERDHNGVNVREDGDKEDSEEEERDNGVKASEDGDNEGMLDIIWNEFQ